MALRSLFSTLSEIRRFRYRPSIDTVSLRAVVRKMSEALCSSMSCSGTRLGIFYARLSGSRRGAGAGAEQAQAASQDDHGLPAVEEARVDIVHGDRAVDREPFPAPAVDQEQAQTATIIPLSPPASPRSSSRKRRLSHPGSRRVHAATEGPRQQLARVDSWPASAAGFDARVTASKEETARLE